MHKAEYRRNYRKNHPDRVKESNEKYYNSSYRTEDNGTRWKPFEIQMLLSKEYSDRELSYILRRSIRAIQVKRSRILKCIS